MEEYPKIEEYIKLADVIRIIKQLIDNPEFWGTKYTFNAGVEAVERAIHQLPVVDYSEPNYAYWRTREAHNDYLWVECSHCGFRVENYNAVELGSSSTNVIGCKWLACPRCTSRMRLKPKDDIENNLDTEIKYFTPDQVRKMNQQEVKANYQKILDSMKYWH